jgi:hypothetical protein
MPDTRGGNGNGKGGDEDVPPGLKRFFGGSWGTTSRYLDAAYGVVGGPLGMGLLGWLADLALGTKPKCMLIGLLIGGIFGFYWLGRVMFSRPS